MERRTLLQKSVVGITAVALSGCSSNDTESPADGDSDETPDSTEETPTGGEGGEQTQTEEDGEAETQTSEDGGEDLPVEKLSKSPYDFTEGESYTYDTETYVAKGVDKWEVTAASDNSVTVKGTATVDGETESTTKSTTPEKIYRTVDLELRRQFLFSNLRDTQFYAGLDALTPGNKFTLDTSDDGGNDWDSETVEVKGETTVNGIPCIKFTAKTSAKSVTKTACVAKEYPFALSLVFKQSGRTMLDATLTNEHRP